MIGQSILGKNSGSSKVNKSAGIFSNIQYYHFGQTNLHEIEGTMFSSSPLQPRSVTNLTLPTGELLDERDEAKFVEHCGVTAIINSPNCVQYTALGLSLLQHRGQDGAGIAVRSRSGEISAVHGTGKVKEALPPSKLVHLNHGTTAIGHTRYGTSGGQNFTNLQPLTITLPELGTVAIAHNGNITNADLLRRELESSGAQFTSTSDTEVILHLFTKEFKREPELTEVVKNVLSKVTGSYALLFLLPDRVIAARDPHGNRPLLLGKMNETTIITSEPCGWDSFGVHSFREIPAATIVEVYPDGNVGPYHSISSPYRSAPCLMELLYFSRPDSTIFGAQVAQFRRRMGELLFQRHPVDADLIVPLMSSGLHYAQGFSEASGIPLRFSLIKNPTSARVFIEADAESRSQQTLEKHALIRNDILGKRVVFVDDSLVRGVTLEQIVPITFPNTKIGRGGASEVHIRIGAPPIIGPCSYGISTPTPEELAANRYGGYSGVGPVNSDLVSLAISKNIGATSVGFGTISDIAEALKGTPNEFCDACFTNLYNRIPR